MRSWLLVLLGTTALAPNCALPSFTRIGARALASGDAGGAGGAGGQGGAAGGDCAKPTFPPAPAGKDLGGSISFTGALHRVFFSKDADGGFLGLDLDGKCTCHGEEQTCVPSDSSKDNKYYCDLPGGRDAASVALFKTVALAQGDPGEFYSKQAHRGFWGLLVRVSDYNGEANDDQVTVTTFGATGFGDLNEPKWDGNDAWPISSASYGVDAQGKPDVNSPKYVDKNGYVTDHVVVASGLPETELKLAGSKEHVTFRLSSRNGLMATIGKDDKGQFMLRKGLVVASFGIKDGFKAVASYRNDNGKPLCTNELFYKIFKDQLCNALDMLEKGGSPTEACNAMSVAIGFETDPAKLGAVVPAPVPTMGCSPATDPANDCCECPFGMILKDTNTCRCAIP